MPKIYYFWISKDNGMVYINEKLDESYRTTFHLRRQMPFSNEWLMILNSPISRVLETCAPIQAHAS